MNRAPSPSVPQAAHAQPPWHASLWLAPLVPLLLIWALQWQPEHIFALTVGVLAVLGAVDALWPQRLRDARFVVAAPPPRARAVGGLWLPRLDGALVLLMLALALWQARSTPWADVWGLAGAVGLVMGLHGVAVGHQLGHSPRRRDKALAWALLTLAASPQFMVEHYRGHHPRAAAWDDAGSAREGEGFWAYLRRAVPRTLANAVRLERQWLAQRRRPVHRSKLLRALCLMLALLMLVTLLLGLRAALLLMVQGAVAVLLLESVNYIEHYGLVRKDGPGNRVPFAAQHGWNASRPMAYVLLLGRTRHSDHHLQPWKRATELQLIDAPELPLGYLVSIPLAWLPPLWSAHMAPHLDRLHRRLREQSSTGDSSLSGTM